MTQESNCTDRQTYQRLSRHTDKLKIDYKKNWQTSSSKKDKQIDRYQNKQTSRSKKHK